MFVEFSRVSTLSGWCTLWLILFLPYIAKAKKSEPHRSACHEASGNTGFPTPPPNGYTATPHGLRSRCHATILVRPYAVGALSAAPRAAIPPFASSAPVGVITKPGSSASEFAIIGEFELATDAEGSVETPLAPSER